MKHLKTVTQIPSSAEIDHPGLIPSILGLIQAPFAVLSLHVNYILDKFSSPNLAE